VGKKQRYDSLGNPIREGESIAANRELFLQEHEPDPARTDEDLYGQVFHQPKLTSTDYLEALRELPEEERRQAWANMTPDQRLELKNAAAVSASSMPGGKVSSAYWLFPIFLGVLGGFVAHALVKDRDPKKARNMLIFGVLFGSTLWIALTIISTLYYYSALTG
jgi:hypothetical protein